MFSKAMCTRAYHFRLFVPIFPDISTVKICNTSNKNEHSCQKVRGKENHKIWDGISDLLLIGMSPCGRLLFCSWSSVLARSRCSDDSRFKSQVIQINPTNRNHQNLCRYKVASSWWCVKGEYKFSCMVIFLTTFFKHLMIKWSTSCLHLLFYNCGLFVLTLSAIVLKILVFFKHKQLLCLKIGLGLIQTTSKQIYVCCKR